MALFLDQPSGIDDGSEPSTEISSGIEARSSDDARSPRFNASPNSGAAIRPEDRDRYLALMQSQEQN